MAYDLKGMVKDGMRVQFSFYRDGNLWYKTHNDFLFPVPIDDIGNATFNAEEKAVLLMRYIRKHINMVEAKEN